VRKLRRVNLTNLKREAPVLVIKPHNRNNQTNELTSQFLAKALSRGIIEYINYASMTPEVARNKGIKEFLNNPRFKKKTHLFFLDDDSPPVNEFMIERLFAFDKPVIAGVYPMWLVKNDKNVLCWSPVTKKEDGKLDNIGVDEMPKSPFKAYRAGGSSLLIKREVLEKLKPPYQKFTYDDECIDLKLGEDMYFCDKIHEAGYEIWIDPMSVSHHFHENIDILEVFNMLMQAAEKGL
jgi:hypothetical protein